LVADVPPLTASQAWQKAHQARFGALRRQEPLVRITGTMSFSAPAVTQRHVAFSLRGAKSFEWQEDLPRVGRTVASVSAAGAWFTRPGYEPFAVPTGSAYQHLRRWTQFAAIFLSVIPAPCRSDSDSRVWSDRADNAERVNVFIGRRCVANDVVRFDKNTFRVVAFESDVHIAPSPPALPNEPAAAVNGRSSLPYKVDVKTFFREVSVPSDFRQTHGIDIPWKVTISSPLATRTFTVQTTEVTWKNR
jgi:hypothetical protein